MDQVGFRGGMRGEDFENPQIKYESGDERGASVALSSKRRPPTTEVMGSSLYRASDRTCEEFVNTLPKVVGFLRVLRFPPTGKNLTGWVRINS